MQIRRAGRATIENGLQTTGGRWFVSLTRKMTLFNAKNNAANLV
jgi:hypothetical protein